MVTRTFKVNEIHCASCENTIRTALSHLPGVAVVLPAERNDVKVSSTTVGGRGTAEDRAARVGFEPVS